MQKSIVYIALILAIIVIFCSIASNGKKIKVNNTKSISTQQQDIQIEQNQVTTNIWDYLHEQQSQKNATTIGESSKDTSIEEETPELTIIVK